MGFGGSWRRGARGLKWKRSHHKILRLAAAVTCDISRLSVLLLKLTYQMSNELSSQRSLQKAWQLQGRMVPFECAVDDPSLWVDFPSAHLLFDIRTYLGLSTSALQRCMSFQRRSHTSSKVPETAARGMRLTNTRLNSFLWPISCGGSHWRQTARSKRRWQTQDHGLPGEVRSVSPGSGKGSRRCLGR